MSCSWKKTFLFFQVWSGKLVFWFAKCTNGVWRFDLSFLIVIGKVPHRAAALSCWEYGWVAFIKLRLKTDICWWIYGKSNLCIYCFWLFFVWLVAYFFIFFNCSTSPKKCNVPSVPFDASDRVLSVSKAQVFGLCSILLSLVRGSFQGPSVY